jgi:hypothetical protein
MSALFKTTTSDGRTIEVTTGFVVEQTKNSRVNVPIREVTSISSYKAVGTIAKGFFRPQRRGFVYGRSAVYWGTDDDGGVIVFARGSLEDDDSGQIVRAFHSAVVHIAQTQGVGIESRWADEPLVTLPDHVQKAGYRIVKG